MGKLSETKKDVKAKTRPVKTGRSRKKGDSAAEGFVGDALRSVYQQTVEEKIPDEFLDILGKLA